MGGSCSRPRSRSDRQSRIRSEWLVIGGERSVLRIGRSGVVSTRYRRHSMILGAALLMALATPAMGQKLKVVTSTTDLYDIAREVGGDRIDARHIGEGYQDPHFIEA